MKAYKEATFILAISMLLLQTAIAQSEFDPLLGPQFNNISFSKFCDKVKSDYDIKIYVHPDTLNDYRVVINSDSISLKEILVLNFGIYGYNVAQFKNMFFITNGFVMKTSLPAGFFKSTNTFSDVRASSTELQIRNATVRTTSNYVQRTFIIGSEKPGNGKKAKLMGLVTNSSDGTPIIGGTIYVKETATGSVTNTNGYYEIELKPGNYNLVFNSIESIERSVSINLKGDGNLNISLDQNLYQLQEVEISSSKTHNVKGVQLGFNKITSKTVKEIPVVLGEQDVLKVAMLLPGVTSVGEGTSGFNVRGSPTDQNLFYFSNIPIYNTSHVFGFFSAFNNDAVESFNLYKGSIPINFGGRLSSVFDIKAKNGNSEKFKVRGGISPITTRIFAEGPIVKNKVSFFTGLRSTYSNWVLKMVKDVEVNRSKAYFGDIIIGIDAILNSTNSLKITGYGSYDDIKLADNSLYTYDNLGGAISWFHSFSPNTEMRVSAVHSEYTFRESFADNPQTAYSRKYKLMSNVVDLNLFHSIGDKHTLTAGFSSLLYDLDRGIYQPYNNESSISTIIFGKEKGLESAVYLSDEWKISPLLTIVGGIRYNFYQYMGPDTVFTYLDNAPKEPLYISDTLYFGNNKVIKSYNSPDFRVSLVYLLNPDLSLKGSYNRLHQYIFLLTNTIAVSPSDTWKLADYNIKPMTGDQFTLGVYANIGKIYEFSVEGYYKFVKNLMEYKNGADLITSKNVEQDALQGELDAYGIEFMLKKPFGKLTGWLNYSYSRSTVLVNNKITGENINFGERYPSNFDRPHSFNIVANLKVSKRISFSGNISYATGRPITYPTSIYYMDGKKILNYSMRNEYRIPDYFRMDIAMKLEGNLLSKKLGHSSFILSVYNLTGRKNAYSVYFKSEDGRIKGYKMSIFGTQIFSITWDFKLGNYND